MWVADLDGEVVGFLASFMVRFKIFERELTIRVPCDLMVSETVRGRGVGEGLIRAYIESEATIANALGYSPAAGRMYQRLGYREVHAEPLMMRPCDLRAILHDATFRRVRGSTVSRVAPSAAALAGSVLNLGLGLVNRARRPRVSDQYDVRPCLAVGDDFDRLWRRISPKFPIAAVRDSEWVRWRFIDDPLFEHRLLCAYDEHDELVGYVDVRTSSRRGLRFGRIIDLFCDPDTPELATTLLAAGGAWLESRGVDVMTCLGHLAGIRREIGRYCYLRPARLQRPAMFLCQEASGFGDQIYDSDRWHLTHADGDDAFSP